ncbi:hypothetical protein [Allorhodopirellula solitaria]|uniref:hypothetical protein n=1 Tax=Allorhodopirellula solitaria TaxID=2527987 RepID=UPI00164798E7|nr:hypothetical protein [Allorhodopirellula solitaria]
MNCCSVMNYCCSMGCLIWTSYSTMTMKRWMMSYRMKTMSLTNCFRHSIGNRS